MHCSNLAADALHEAIINYRQGQEALLRWPKLLSGAAGNQLCKNNGIK
jgi:hypothetical protein